ncbi:hypothetical protein GCM10025857_37470 [Alicyclobacillus contaminans]|uniref:hypothetical protein n=1 Tax=Alicyclobacillus contaminans TaxID=392016 RepID=UPI0003FB2E9D|nr:hypothetical protein [Alicyclobacillus contaminans]GMA52390.1 hypothetical protein GCM10025857_37470 [Alicyclobacillus contaminans]
MLRAVGAGLLLMSCTAVGFRVAREFRQRPRHLRALIHALRVLEAEVDFNAAPLPQALRRVVARSQPPADTLFGDMLHHLDDPACSPADALAQAVATCQPKTALRATDVEVLRELGLTLGLSDRQHQTRQIQACILHLTQLEREAAQAQRHQERLWQYVGVLTGLLLVVLLY